MSAGVKLFVCTEEAHRTVKEDRTRAHYLNVFSSNRMGLRTFVLLVSTTQPFMTISLRMK